MAGHSAQGVVRVSRKPKTASETEIVRLITATNESTPIGNFSQLVKDMAAAGIVISGDQVAIKGDKVTIYNKDEVALFAQDGKLNANLINADTITVNHLYAKSSQGGSVVGHFGNYDKSDAVAGDDKCPLWLGAATAANAPFRVTKEGAMYAVKGKIGGFEIGSSSIGSQTLSGTISKMYLCDDFIGFHYQYSPNKQIKSRKHSALGSRANSTNGDILLSLTAEIENNVSYTCAATINVSNFDKNASINSVVERTGLAISVDGGGYGNHAIKLENGDIAGFRLNTKVVTTGYNVTNDDNIIVCKNTSQITVLLPISPQKGQIFYIRQTKANVQIKCSGYKMYGDALSTEYSILSNKSNQMTVCTFDGSAWYVNYYNG